MPKNYWVRAVDTTWYNKVLVVKVKITKKAFEKLHGRKPKSDHLKIYGCVGFSKNRDASKKSKFHPKTTKCMFIGLFDYTTAICYLLQNTKTRQFFASRKVKFNENNLPCFHNRTEDTENSVPYLDLDRVREEIQDTGNSNKLSSEVEKTETESVKNLKLNRKPNKKNQVLASNQKQKLVHRSVQKSQ